MGFFTLRQTHFFTRAWYSQDEYYSLIRLRIATAAALAGFLIGKLVTR
jgi:hypothetical protein